METANRVAPWRADIAWWAVGIQGAVALLLGLWLLFNQAAGEPVLAVVGLLVLGIGALWAWSAMRSDLPQTVLGWRGLRGGVAVLTGSLVVLDFLVDYLTVPAALVVTSVGLLLAGIFGAAEWWVGRAEMQWRWPSLIGPLVAAVFGLVMLLSRLQAAPIFLQVIAIAAIVVGVLLLVRAGLLFQAERMAARTDAIPDVSASTPVPQASAGTSAPTVTVRSAGSTKPSDPSGPAGGGTPAA